MDSPYPTLIYIAGAIILTVIYQILFNRQHKQTKAAMKIACDCQNQLIRELKKRQTFDDNATDGEVCLLNDADRNRFVVCRDGFIIKAVKYDPSDADDREYKLIYIMEVAEKLNEKP